MRIAFDTAFALGIFYEKLLGGNDYRFGKIAHASTPYDFYVAHLEKDVTRKISYSFTWDRATRTIGAT